MPPKPTFRPLLAALMITASPLAAQVSAPARLFELPLLDAPYNFAHGYRAPSMQQSLSVTTNFYEASHFGIQKVWGERKWLARGSVLLFDYFTIAVPFADAWLHEEWHRVALGNRGIGSRNDVYDLGNIFSEAISVSHVRDEDLIRLKRDHPQDMVRVKAAGIEAEYQLITQLEKNRFFRNARSWNTALYWFTALNSIAYVGFTDQAEVDSITDEANRTENTFEVRDISGHDFTAWVYDLHRPDEPFEARGAHPSGVGIDRYIKISDLTPEEVAYLERQGRLAYLNLWDPNLFGLHGFTVRNPLSGRPLMFNLAARHLLTSFGHTVDANIFLKQNAINLFLVLHSYANGARRFPGVDAQLLDLPVTIGGKQLALSPRAAVWLQPQDQQFRTTSGAAGGLAAIRVDYPLAARFGSYVELEGKTAGWVAGNVHLDPNLSLRLGVSASLR